MVEATIMEVGGREGSQGGLGYSTVTCQRVFIKIDFEFSSQVGESLLGHGKVMDRVKNVSSPRASVLFPNALNFLPSTDAFT